MWRRLAWIAGALCLAGGVGGAVVAETVGSAVTTYRRATATDASVQSLLAVSGTVTPLHRSTAAFQVAGTVASVAVQVGEQVTAGETLATLETTSLEKAVTTAEANLSAAGAALAADEAAQATAAHSQTTGASGSTTAGTGSASSSGTGSSLAAAQEGVVRTQATEDAQAKTAAAALGRARSACASSPSGTGGGGTPGPTQTGTTGAGATGTASRTGRSGTAGAGVYGANAPPARAGPASAQACTAALTPALAAENQLSADQRGVAQAEDLLARILESAAATGTGTHDGNPTGPSSGARGTASTASTGSTATDGPARLASDQSTIDSDQAKLIEAKQALAASVLKSSITGTVAAVTLRVGESVGAGSTSDAITIVGQGSYDATGTLTSGDAREVKVGDTAVVSVDGDSHELTGVVTRVGPVDVGSGDTYPLVVALSPSAAKLFTGSNAQIEVIVRHADNVLCVPTSAVHTDGAGHSYVVTLEHGTEVQTPVTVGIVGAVDTQIVSGLHRGEVVVLANVTEPVPASSTTSGRFGPAGGALGNGRVVFNFSPGQHGPGLKQVHVTTG